jgi:hypothetical protein
MRDFAETVARVSLVVLVSVPLASEPVPAAEPVTTCGQVLADGGFLTADLDCSGYTDGPALTIERGVLDLAGFTLTGNEVESIPLYFPEATVFCPVSCEIIGPGVLAGGKEAVVHARRRIALTDVTVRDVTAVGNASAVYSEGSLQSTGCTIEGNSGDGLVATRRAIVQSTTIQGTHGSAVAAYGGKAFVQDSTITGNGTGFAASTVVARIVKMRSSDVSDNGGPGIDAEGFAKVTSGL